MQNLNHNQRYTKPIIFLHWFTVLLMIAVYATIELRVIYPKGTEPREFLKALHFMFGLAVLVTVVLRAYFRVTSTAPKIVPPPGRIATALAHFMHLILYIFMIALPIAGWLMLSAAGKTIPFFGLELPPLIAENKALAKEIKQIHQTVGNIGYFLIAFHAAAALFHHYVMRDNAIKRMRW